MSTVLPQTTDRKQRVRDAFARAAASYDAHGTVQQEIAKGLLQRISLPNATPGRILEVGCGTGNLTMALRQCSPDAQITAVDFCDAMLERAQRKLGDDGNIEYLLADGESLEFSAGQFDLITSSSAVQWFDDPAKALARYASMLRPEGRLVISLFGPRTFEELGAVVGDELSGRQLPAALFPSCEQLEQLLGRAFQNVSVEEQAFTREYPSVLELLRSIRHTGTAGGHWQGMLSRARLEQLEERYRAQYGVISATYQVCYCTAVV